MATLVKPKKDTRSSKRRLQDLARTSKRKTAAGDKSKRGQRIIRDWNKNAASADIEGVDTFEAGHAVLGKSDTDKRSAKRRLQDMGRTSKRKGAADSTTKKGKALIASWKKNPSRSDLEGVDDAEAGEQLLAKIDGRRKSPPSPRSRAAAPKRVKSPGSPKRARPAPKKVTTARADMSPKKTAEAVPEWIAANRRLEKEKQDRELRGIALRAQDVAERAGHKNIQEAMRVAGWTERKIEKATPKQTEKFTEEIAAMLAETAKEKRLEEAAKRNVEAPEMIDKFIKSRPRTAHFDVFEKMYRDMRAAGEPHRKSVQKAIGAQKLAEHRAKKKAS